MAYHKIRAAVISVFRRCTDISSSTERFLCFLTLLLNSIKTAFINLLALTILKDICTDRIVARDLVEHVNNI